MGRSIDEQTQRLINAGYPEHLLTSVAGSLLQKLKRGQVRAAPEHQHKVAVVPYLHTISHRLKRIGQKAGVRVVFSAPDKLSKLCRRVNAPAVRKPACPVRHQAPFVPCQVGAVYKIALSCGKAYVGQTGRCLNERLMEHSNSVYNTTKRNLGVHCLKCPSQPCEPSLHNCTVIARNAHQFTREIIEAAHILKLGQNCVSTPSIALTKRELEYLNQTHSSFNV